jgi:hypothetical protein
MADFVFNIAKGRVAEFYNRVVTVWLSGGTHNTDYDILCHITTSDSRTLDMTMTVPVRSQ